MPAGHVGAVRAAVVEHRSQPGEGTVHIGPVQRRVQRAAEDVEQKCDVRLGCLRYVVEAVHRLVGGTDVDPAVGLGYGEDELGAPTRYRYQQFGIEPTEPFGAQHQVGTARGPQPYPVDQVTGPHAGGVDHGPRTYRQLGTGQLVAHLCPVATEGGHPAPGQDAGTEPGRGTRDRDDQPGVVLELAVPAQLAAAQAGPAQPGRPPQGLRRRQPPGPGEQPGRRAGRPAQRIATGDPGPVQREGARRYGGRQRQQHR